MREYKVGWGEAWPTLTVEVPDNAELAVMEASFEPAPELPETVRGVLPRSARFVYVKLMFIDLDDGGVVPSEIIARHPSARLGIVREEDS